MKCPKCKKLTELQTKRTMANGSKVMRERYCPRCKTRFMTIEQFQFDIEKADQEHAGMIRSLSQKHVDLLDSLNLYRDLFKGFKQCLDEVGKTK